MAKITAFDRATCAVVSKRIEERLADLATELGVKITTKGGTFSGGHYTLKLEVATVSDTGMVNTREADAFKQLAALYGMSPDDLGKEFTANGKTYRITGLASRRSVRPVIAADVRTSKSYVFTVADVKLFLLANKG